jgi:hypothetical protein
MSCPTTPDGPACDWDPSCPEHGILGQAPDPQRSAFGPVRKWGLAPKAEQKPARHLRLIPGQRSSD